MEEKLDFSLPENKPTSSGWGRLFALVSNLLLVVLVLLLIANLLGDDPSTGPQADPVASGLSAEQTRELAARLARRDLYEQAAEVWQDYLSVTPLSGAERARALFQVGTLLERAGQYDAAIEHYYRSEMSADVDELRPEINAHIKNCFEKLGRFSALRYELMERTSPGDATDPAGRIAAEIGAEKITLAELETEIEAAVESQLAQMSAFLTAEQLNEQKKQMLEQYGGPEAKLQFARQWVAQEILYREALAQDLPSDPQTKKLLDDLTRQALSQQLMNRQIASKVNITEGDLRTYYQANRDKYVEPPKAQIRHILVSEQNRAKELIEQLKDGADFAQLAREHSQDEATKDAGGAIETPVTPGTYVAGVGDANALNEAIFEAEPPAVLEAPFETDKGWEIVKVEQVQPERQQSFDEVSRQVMMNLMEQKRREVQQEFIDRMMDKYNVIVHASAFAPARQSMPKKEEPKQDQ